MADKRFISADKTIAEIRRKYCKECRRLDGECCRAYECKYEDCIDIIKDAPTADVQEVKHGKWETSKGERYSGRCSCCNCYSTDDYKYCPNCGAKMDLKE